MTKLTRNGTDGRVYGGDCNLVHIGDGQRKRAGSDIATYIDTQMRDNAFARGKPYEGPLCPGCYMIALFNAAVFLAERNGQPLVELGKTMALAFTKLAENPDIETLTEEITVILDND